MNKWLRIIIIFLIVLTLIIISLMGYSFKKVFRLKKVDWIPVKGRVKSSKLHVRRKSPFLKYTITQYLPKVCFDYQYDSEKYTSCSHYKFFVSKKNAETIVNNAKVGSEITVYVNPEDPNESYIDKNNISYSEIWIVSLEYILLIGVVFIAFY